MKGINVSEVIRKARRDARHPDAPLDFYLAAKLLGATTEEAEELSELAREQADN
jgi:hypothetical protein